MALGRAGSLFLTRMISAITAPRRFIPTLSLSVLAHGVSMRAWGLRLRRTGQELALALLPMLPSAHYKGVGVRIASLRSWIPTPPILCLRFVGSLTVATQDSRPSGSLFLSRETLSFSTSCRFSPAHCNGDFSTIRGQ